MPRDTAGAPWRVHVVHNRVAGLTAVQSSRTVYVYQTCMDNGILSSFEPGQLLGAGPWSGRAARPREVRTELSRSPRM
jgi:hypothetical protein